jgi:polar amino acid transport system substrate-binding protein
LNSSRPGRWIGLRRAGLAGLAAVACLAAMLATLPGARAADVFIPGFWETNQRLEKPEISGLKAIRFLTDDDYPPMHFLTEDGRLAGYNVDLARALCDILNVACTIQARRWDTLLDALKEGRGDAVIASLRATRDLRGSFAVTAPYLRTPGRFVGRNGVLAAVTPETLGERTVVAVSGSAHESYLRTFFPKATLLSVDDLDRAKAALQRGEADVLFGDGLTLAIWLNTEEGSRCCAFAGGPYTESRWFGEGVVIAMRPNDPLLRRALDYALQRAAETGVHAELYLRWFPVGFY